MSRQDPEAGRHKKLAANRFCVVTQSNHVATQLRLLHHNYVVTVSKSVAIELKQKLRSKVTTEDYKLRQRPATRT